MFSILIHIFILCVCIEALKLFNFFTSANSFSLAHPFAGPLTLAIPIRLLSFAVRVWLPYETVSSLCLCFPLYTIITWVRRKIFAHPGLFLVFVLCVGAFSRQSHHTLFTVIRLYRLLFAFALKRTRARVARQWKIHIRRFCVAGAFCHSYFFCIFLAHKFSTWIPFEKHCSSC